MASTPKHRHDSIYGLLLHLYPPSFQQHFASTMEQTFGDMLADTPSRPGRILLWIKTMANLPFSAAGEHVTSGRQLFTSRGFKLVAACAASALVVVGVGSFWFGTLHARETTSITRVSVADLGDAMQHDSFYSTYGSQTLIFSGEVTAVSHHDGTIVTFAGSHTFSVSCQLASTSQPHLHETMSIVAPGGKAVRQAHGVLLKDCVQN